MEVLILGRIHYKNMEILYEKSVYTKDFIRKVNLGVYGGGTLTLIIAFITYFLRKRLFETLQDMF